MAASTFNSKTHYHARSISLPSRPHPLIPQFNERLCRLRACEASSSSSSSIGHKLGGLKDLHDYVDDLLQLPLTQQALAQKHDEKWVDELLDGSLRLLDVCSTAKDALLQTKEHAQEIQSILRRRQGSEFGLAKEVGEYLACRKKVKKAIQMALKNLKGIENKFSFSPLNEDHEPLSMVSTLREVETVTLTVLESLLSLIAGPKGQSKPSSWSLVSKLVPSKRIASEDKETDGNEFDKVDAALHALISHKTNKSGSNMHVESVQIQLGKLELSIEDLEVGLECLFRRLIKTRVSLLNILNH